MFPFFFHINTNPWSLKLKILNNWKNFPSFCFMNCWIVLQSIKIFERQKRLVQSGNRVALAPVCQKSGDSLFVIAKVSTDIPQTGLVWIASKEQEVWNWHVERGERRELWLYWNYQEQSTDDFTVRIAAPATRSLTHLLTTQGRRMVSPSFTTRSRRGDTKPGAPMIASSSDTSLLSL